MRLYTGVVGKLSIKTLLVSIRFLTFFFFSRILLVGYYLDMPGYLSSVQHCVNFWSSGACQINFSRLVYLSLKNITSYHDFPRLAPSLGAIGASLCQQTNAPT
jgi:hypothetical protein